MKTTWTTRLTGLLMAAVLAAALPVDADAKRLGGGKSTGMQRDMPARTAPDAAPAKPAAPAQQAAPATPGTPAAAAATPPKRSWLGPLAGLAAGLGLAALFSALGLGEGLANFVMLMLLLVVGFVAVRWLLRRFGPQPAARTGGMQYAGATAGAAPPAPAGWSSSPGTAQPLPPVNPAPVPATPTTPAGRVFVPAAFDSESFARTAKAIFIRLQAANDARNLDDLRSFTTPEMFAELSLDIQDRGGAAQQTEVLRVDAEVIDVAEEAMQQVVSVRYRGELREESGAAPTAFDEVWHLVKPRDDSRNWAIAGIEQMGPATGPTRH